MNGMRARGRDRVLGFSSAEDDVAITGAHILLYTSEAEKLRATLRDVFGWKHVDAGDGWLIFALPPTELGVHPAEGPSYESGVRHQFTLMCDDIHATIRELRAKGVAVKGKPEDEGWGVTVMLGLPGGVEVMLYEPRHAVAIAPAAR
jgi:predicted enzyme related to lactoylglutathione lyase